MLGANTEHDVAVGATRLQGAAQVVGDLELAERAGDASIAESRRDEVHRRGADEAGDEQVARVVVELLRRADLLHDAAAHDDHPVTQRHRLGLVVGDVERRRAEGFLDARDLGAHLHAQLGVEVAQRLVHEERLGLTHDRAPHRHALALAAGQVRGASVEVLGEFQHLRRLLDLLPDRRLVLARELQREAHVLGDRHVRVQRVGLEDHRDVAVLGRLVVDDLAVDAQFALGDVLQARDHVQRRRLSAARGSDEDDELPVVDVQVEVVDGEGAVGVPLDHVLEHDLGHVLLLRKNVGRG